MALGFHALAGLALAAATEGVSYRKMADMLYLGHLLGPFWRGRFFMIRLRSPIGGGQERRVSSCGRAFYSGRVPPRSARLGVFWIAREQSIRDVDEGQVGFEGGTELTSARRTISRVH